MFAGSRRLHESTERVRFPGDGRYGCSEHHGGERGQTRTMKIAQIAPLYESVPPKLYGGTERIVSYLTEELVARNHDVTLFASADSVTRARLVPASSWQPFYS